MTFVCLVVCSANICRSPAAAALLSRGHGTYGLDGVSFVSCGVNPVDRRATCDHIFDGLFPVPEVDAVRRAHETRLLTRELIVGADLVLTADRLTRSAVVHLDPGARHRTFTLREAAGLSQLAVERIGEGVRPTSKHPLVALIDEMNDCRGLVDFPDVEHHRRLRAPWRTLAVHPHDVPDAHDGAPHWLTRDLLRSSTTRLGASFLAVCRG